MSKNKLVEVVKYAPPVLLPVLTVVCTAVAGANQGPVRVYWSLGTVASVLATGLWGTLKEVRARKLKLVTRGAIEKLQITLAEASQPLVDGLGNIAVARDRGTRESAIWSLVERAIATARAQCGSGSRDLLRCAFYAIEGDTLRRVRHEGRVGGAAPREVFDPADGDYAKHVIKSARAEEILLVEDLQTEAPEHFGDPKKRTFRTLIAVPVRANGHRFGLLSIDSPEPGTLSAIDARYMILIAGVLAAGLARRSAEDAAGGAPAGSAEEGRDE